MAPATALTIRPAHPGDDHRIRSILVSSYLQYADVLPPLVLAAHLCDLIDLDGRGVGAEFLVAEMGGAVVGMVMSYTDADDAGFDWPRGWSVVRALAVAPAHRGRSVGRRLMEACIEQAGAGCVDGVGVHTAEFMTAAAHLYESMGFRRAPSFDVDVARKSAGFSLVATAYTLAPASMAAAAA
jgi:ribosomal protein S18 acetylase RimI-like enzyme